MTRSISRTIVVIALVLVFIALMATAAFAAAPYDGAAFGEHVSTMAQAGHLGTEHNPGMHQGITGWQTMQP